MSIIQTVRRFSRWTACIGRTGLDVKRPAERARRHKARSLRMELLEQRALLSVVPIATTWKDLAFIGSGTVSGQFADEGVVGSYSGTMTDIHGTLHYTSNTEGTLLEGTNGGTGNGRWSAQSFLGRTSGTWSLQGHAENLTDTGGQLVGDGVADVFTLTGAPLDPEIEAGAYGMAGTFDTKTFKVHADFPTGQFNGTIRDTVASKTNPFDVVVTAEWVSDKVNVDADVLGPVQKAASHTTPVTNIQLYWAKGPNYSNKIGKPLGDDFSIPVYWNSRSGEYDISDLPPAPAGATHLLLTVKVGSKTRVAALELPTVSVAPAEVAEGSGLPGAPVNQADFKVTLSRAYSKDVTVSYSTVKGTAEKAAGTIGAVPGVDYGDPLKKNKEVTGSIVIPARQTEGLVSIPILGNTKLEPDKTFSLKLTQAQNAGVDKAGAQAKGTITNDDPIPTISIDPVAKTEGNSGTTKFTFTVTLSNPTFQKVTAKYSTPVTGTDATADPKTDYTPVTKPVLLTIPAGQLTKTFTVSVKGDKIGEQDEWFYVDLSDAVNATIPEGAGRAKGTINDDDGAPEVAVKGNGQVILDNDTTPGSVDGTDFGSVAQGGAAISRTFYVWNDGNATLTLSGLSVPSGLTVTDGLVSSLAPGASDTITVRLDTAVAGTKSGQISFTNNDGDGGDGIETPFNFAITGTVTASQPALTFTHVPPIGGSDDLRGTVGNVTPADYKVAVIIKVEGLWWTKPTFAQPAVPIATDGSWSANIVSGGNDLQATEIRAYLVPAVYAVPLHSGVSDITPDLIATAVASEQTTRGTVRTVEFAGLEWEVKSGTNLLGPGPNYFSASPQSVWVDGEGLHLKIHQEGGNWVCSEVFTTVPTTYGIHRFVTESRVDQIDKNVVLGLFLYGGVNTEVDVEFSRWGQDNPGFNSQFVVQPWDTPGNLERFTSVLNGEPSTASFDWEQGTVSFRSYLGDAIEPLPGQLIHEWAKTSSGVPSEQDALQVRMNLWLNNGTAPSDLHEVEVIIKSADFPISHDGPEIVVNGNGHSIADGDPTPSAADDTDFGSTVQGGAVVSRTFTVANTGQATLALGMPTVPTGYTVTEALSSSIAPGTSDTFTVTLSTASTGTFLGEISFTNNDGDGGDGVESPFNFAIKGVVSQVQRPEIAVVGLGQSIADGDTTPSVPDDTDFGSVVQSGTGVSHTFTIRNTGTAALTVGTVSVPSGFTVTKQPASSIAAGSSDTLIVRLETGSVGNSGGDVTFTNNDGDGGDGVESPFNFAIKGTVTTSQPTITFTYVPPIGNWSNNLTGIANNVPPADYKVAVVIKVGAGWWSKPTFAQPWVLIATNGSWSADISTGGSDDQATDIAAFIVPAGYSVPLHVGDSEISADLIGNAVARRDVHRGP